jgi:tetratricopeptide (TPR) repeat protein
MSKETKTLLSRTFVIALLTAAAPLAFAVPSFAQDAAAPAAAQMTPEQIAAFNQAVTDFTAGQTAQQGGDNSTAAAKYEAALPAIRAAVQTDPAKIENVNFLANALYADAAAQGALGKMDKVIALYGESAPYWRKLVEAKPTDAASRNIFAGILIQMGNQKMVGQDKAGADPLYKEALTLARKSVAENRADAVSRNILLSALISASQTANDQALTSEALNMGKAMLSDGTIDAMNKPSVQAMTGAKAG